MEQSKDNSIVTGETLRTLAREGVQSIKQKNAVQPLAWFCLFISIPSLYLATKTDWPTNGLLGVAAGIPILLFAFAYTWFMFTDPGRLQSEEYQLRSRALDIIETKGGRITVNPTEIRNVLNPYASDRLPSPADKEGEA